MNKYVRIYRSNDIQVSKYSIFCTAFIILLFHYSLCGANTFISSSTNTQFTIPSMKYAATLFTNQEKNLILFLITQSLKKERSGVDPLFREEITRVSGLCKVPNEVIDNACCFPSDCFWQMSFRVKETCMRLLRYSYFFFGLLFLGRGERIDLLFY